MTLLPLAEAATRIGVSHVRLRQLVAEGRVPAVRVGRTWAVEEATVHALGAHPRRPGKPAWWYIGAARLVDRLFQDCRALTVNELATVSGMTNKGSAWSSASWQARDEIEQAPKFMQALEAGELELHRVAALWPPPFTGDDWVRSAAEDALVALIVWGAMGEGAASIVAYAELVRPLAMALPWLLPQGPGTMSFHV